jgi:flagellar protein FlgJ
VDPDQFVRQVWPQAEAAARELGLPTEVVVGHAALETGWGRHQPAGDSNNLFGIKADAGWRGAKASSETREVRAGVEQTERADFRRYDSAAESVADYVRFLRGNPRYAQALAHGGDAVHFAQGLQKAGYATDPRYASKLLGVIERVRGMRAA